jgi:transcriptional regulator with XRE-family HTH domain
MARKRKGFFARPRPKLFLGEWLSALGIKPVTVAKEVGLTESYLSGLISGVEKVNPSSHLMFEISEYLGISVNQLYRPPPPRQALQAIETLPPAVVGRLAAQARKRASS